MKKPIIDFKKLRAGEDVKCPKCNIGILRTDYNPQTSPCFKCDNCGMMINFD